MAISLGIDIGAVSVKAAAVLPEEQIQAILQRGSALGLRQVGGRDAGKALVVADVRRTRGQSQEVTRQMLSELLGVIGEQPVGAIVLTGSGAPRVSEALAVDRCNEFQAIARAVGLLYPHVRTVFEMGGETSKYLALSPDPQGGLSILDYSTNGDCAAGTGSFLDQQAKRLKYVVEEIGEIVAATDRTAQIAGRCSVFAKSDMIHAQQKGFTPPEVLRGLCKAVATNYRSAVVKGRTPAAPIAFIGGVSANSAVVKELRGVFDLAEAEMFVPAEAQHMAAIGAALVAADRTDGVLSDLSRERIAAEPRGAQDAGFATSAPLTLDNVLLLRNHARPYQFSDDDGGPVEAYLGLDIGSVGTKLVVIDRHGHVIHDIFTRTEGRPIEVVSRIMKELEQAVGRRIQIRGVGTTGSGRELIGELVGADAITDEITCHKTGASFVGDKLLNKKPDTIFEIGGQDSKYISLQSDAGMDGDMVVVDFTMNEACAAGTGSFLEERAEELGVAIKEEFSRLALSSTAPTKLGERCTVFMERDVNTAIQRGARKEDVIAGLAYSVVYNYINRVVRGRPIGEVIFFQGGTAYNDAVAAAFSAVCGKRVIVPPHNAVLGAIGAALVAREKVAATKTETRFRGYDMKQVHYTLREFTCKGCGNQCSVQEFNVEGEKTYWGDKCSDRYRKRVKSNRKPMIADLVALRRELLVADDGEAPRVSSPTIGIPLSMYSYDLLPLWRRFFRDCGFNVVVSDETNRQTVTRGLDAVVAEPCFPIIVAHGHVAELVEKKVDYIWLPNILSAETRFLDNESHVCPWGQTLPFVVRQSPAFSGYRERILCPTIRLREKDRQVREVLIRVAGQLGVAKSVAKSAFEAGWAALQRFRGEYQKAGREALETLERTGESGMVVVGRPYNIHDPGVSLSTARKLREHYGVNVIPIDALPIADVDIRDINGNMYWDYGRRILAASRIIGQHPNLHMIYITNFKCGPDSFVKLFVRPASGKPFLTLQFDGHSNDAGMMTRCEAYLDSKGILRWWRTCKSGNEPAAKPSVDGRSTSPRWPTPARA